MNTKTLGNHALTVIDQYLNFKIGEAVCSIPYFNNKTLRTRAALRALAGKGSPQEIFEEIKGLMLKDHVDISTVTGELLKKTLTDNNIGIDCSAFTYYVLNSQSQELKKGSLDKHIHFINCHGIIGKIRCALRPIENCDVATFAHDKNSQAVAVDKVEPGDIITMVGGPDNSDRDHVLVIYQIEYQNFSPIKIHYAHAVAYPEDGIYGSGIKKGIIEILHPDKPITEQIWTENEKVGESNRIFVRAQKSQTILRRLHVFTGQ
ncbi:MAG: NlpC/P60 family protein [Candidatus Pacebacteria bacterium]|nr:NlpC/P60 family protein [Candidatus Paceibacterota bacterium]